MKYRLALMSLICIYNCSCNKYLKQCQIDAVDGLNKSVTVLSEKLPFAQSKITKYSYENSIMSQVVAWDNDSDYTAIAKKIDSVSKNVAERISQDQYNLNNQQVAWSLFSKIIELLKAISNPEFSDAVKNNKEGFSVGVDSLIKKYNALSSNKINENYGKLFSQIASQIGKHTIKKRQKEYFKQAIDSSGPALFTILELFVEIEFKNYEKDISTLQEQYFYSYIELNRLLSGNKMNPELAHKMLTDLENIKRELFHLKSIRNYFVELSKKSQTLIAALMDSMNGKDDCNAINSILTDVEILLINIQTSFSFI